MTAFQEFRVYVVPCRSKPDFIGFSQGDEGPIHIHVGTGLSDARLHQAWECRQRFPTLTLDHLTAARDGKVEKAQVA